MIELQNILAARKRLKGITKVTPLLSSEQLSLICGNELFLKAEHLQKTGSFKIRGATNKVKHAVKAGATYITAASSGNHGQAVAYIGNKLGVPTTIVVPENASLCKINAIKAYNGVIEKCGMTSTERILRAKEIAVQKNGVFIPPYDDDDVISGQGTIALEVLEQLEDVEAIVVPIGGGGLVSGILTAIKESHPKVKVIGVEPELANDTYLSLRSKSRVSIDATKTIADGLRTSQPGEVTFPILQKYLDDLVLVSEEEIRTALYFVLERMKQLIEPSSAVSIAAAMSAKLGFTGKKVVVVISGGNVDLEKLPQLFPKD
ncbi:threonine/serine dehydratase [Bacillus aquiflavi]|uniref:threonine ammonia-lyase n=1 Tax=Bacillus aquiflavi TaxID=2672567 RepID=A0A6B3W3Q6_9BACI|nr:threonine/serine dehydratase [Bacillus aquiflavi]MBA4537868.1 threonine/serine dehydratase [Bacillus aquiflavi]NEY82124.1 threonine/serine dehydratase [Bacillus aquiflavi]UAC48432.1 threonine/serine dehydratase [Bacillus aquiflavi]